MGLKEWNFLTGLLLILLREAIMSSRVGAELGAEAEGSSSVAAPVCALGLRVPGLPGEEKQCWPYLPKYWPLLAQAPAQEVN